jgi:hypothetical protein
MRAGRSRLRVASVIAFVLGVGLMIPFEATATRLAGIISFAAFVVLGLAAVAEPGFLAADGEEEDPGGGPG